MALPAARLTRARISRVLLLAFCSALLTAAVAHYDMAHAWLLDAVGGAVRGALVFGISHARREALDSLPLLAFCLLGWVLLGGAEARRLIAAALRGTAWPWLLAGSACLTWGFLVHGAALDAVPGIMLPPAIYAPLGLLGALGASLVLARGWQARRSGAAGDAATGELGIVAVCGLALAYLAGLGSLLAVTLAGGLIAASTLPGANAGPGRALRLAIGALCAVCLYGAGAMAVPGIGLPVVDALTLAGLLGAGTAFAGLAFSARSRMAAAFWLVVLFVALALLALGGGRGDMVGLCGALLGVMLLFLLLPGRTSAGRLGDAALCCLGLLAAATAVFLA